ncbi:GNAT family N-acetyltransferase [Streptomyces sp. NA04227]|uniref:GNAT family N-acetyltransferase n=1 Tax=Streptomyces sp. NA04227 TaxID=2742136 RepID=UPI0015909B42|nr:GNAT family protein [Streptomyces sp. NA04227]QKW07312.1 GNAT family N-acetyltransferase [Streptomyces sp. NA04227]
MPANTATAPVTTPATSSGTKLAPALFSLPLRDNARLAPLEVCHAEEFAAHMDRARDHIRPWVGAGFVTDGVEAARALLHRYAERQAGDGARLFGIWLDGTLVGGVMFTDFNAALGQCELGCWTEPLGEGHGLVTQSCRVLLDWAVSGRGLHRVEWHCRADNGRSIAVAERLGMTLEGVRREAWPFDGRRFDKQLWAVLASEHKPESP